jgi:hypothetical protein
MSIVHLLAASISAIERCGTEPAALYEVRANWRTAVRNIPAQLKCLLGLQALYRNSRCRFGVIDQMLEIVKHVWTLGISMSQFRANDDPCQGPSAMRPSFV